MIRVWEDKESGRVVVDVDGRRVELTRPQAYILARRIGQLLGLRVSLGRPLASFRYEGGHVVADIVEGEGVRRFVVPMKLLTAYVNAIRKLAPGKYPPATIAREAFLEARRLGMREVEEFLDGDSIKWELLFGTRDKYYELFRAPVLLLCELGLVEYGKRRITVKQFKPDWRRKLEEGRA